MTENQGPKYNMDTMPIRWRHIRILIIASAGQFFGGALAILIGVRWNHKVVLNCIFLTAIDIENF